MLFVINKILYKKVLKIKKIKVIQVISDSNIGGAGKVVLTLLSCFDKNEIDCEIIIPKNSQLKSYIKDMGYKIFEISSFGEVSFDFDLTKKLVKVFKREKPDIVHTHASLSARIAAKILKIKVVYTRHWLGLKKTNFLLKLINNYFCDVAIAVS
jgi:glycosyltransferase involved in cell wall biosynthesis